MDRIEVLTKAFQKLLVWTLEVDKALHTEAREAVVLDKSDEMVTDDSGQ
jgi:hypothetical protein